MKTVVYRWRLSRRLKSDLQRAARSRQVPVSAILNLAVREWLAKNAVDFANDEEQKRLHAAVAPYLGAIAGGDPGRSEIVREIVRKRLARKYGH
jgi:hypothetical protein